MSRTANERSLERVSTSDFSSGGLLEPEQFNQFIRDVQAQSDVLSRARFVGVDAPSGDIPRIGVGSRLLQGVSEQGSATKQTPDQPSVPYQTTKVSLPWEMSWEASNETVDSAESTIRDLFANQFGVDLEILASVGDESSADAFESINDGWLTLAASRGAPSYDHANAAVDKELFDGMLRQIDEKYEEGQTLAFLTSHSQKQAFKDYLTDRSTGAGDAMLTTGDEPRPYGYEIVTPRGWPDNTAMLTSMENLAYIVQDDMRVKQTSGAERNVMNDVETIYNMLAKVDYQIMDEQGVVIGNNVAAP